MHNTSNKKLNKICILRRHQELMKDLKAVYKAQTEDLALTNLGIFEEKWGKKYPMCVSSWKTTGQNYQHILNIQKE